MQKVLQETEEKCDKFAALAVRVKEIDEKLDQQKLLHNKATLKYVPGVYLQAAVFGNANVPCFSSLIYCLRDVFSPPRTAQLVSLFSTFRSQRVVLLDTCIVCISRCR